MAKRSSILLILGAAFFVLGAAIVYLVAQDDDDETAAGVDPAKASVLVSQAAIASGASGSDLVASGAVDVKQVDASEAAPGALTSVAALTGRTFATDVPEGVQIREADLRPATLRGNLPIPEGKQGMAVQVPFVPGVAGYVGPGDHVNVYAVVDSGPQAPLTKLLLPNVQVLDVSREVAPRVNSSAQPASADSAGTTAGGGARDDGGSITYLLAVDPVEAERLIFVVSNESLYLTLVPPEQAPAATGGESYQGVLR